MDWRDRAMTMMDRLRFSLALLGIASLLPSLAGESPSLIPETVLSAARDYLATTDKEERDRLAALFHTSSFDPVQTVRALRPHPVTDVAPGYHKSEHFLVPELRKRHPDDLLYYVVPESYTAKQPVPLAVVMHGGAKGTERTMAHWYMRPDPKGSGLGKAFMDTGMIGVGPSAPISTKRWERWCLPEADDYLRDVIIEMQSRFNIDPDRVFLLGHSMGGFGAYQAVQVQPDRFAAVLVHAGSWYTAYWPVIRGTPLWVVHGVHDSEPGGRPHYTDIAFARLTGKLLTKQGIVHEVQEHQGQHSLPNGMPVIREFIARMPELRRDPFQPRAVVASPRGWRTGDMRDAPHNRWLSIVETTPGKLTYDTTKHEGAKQFWGMPRENWGDWALKHVRKERPGAMVDATNLGGNRFEATTHNVRRFAIWLHPRMVNFSKPVQVTVNGAPALEQRVQPSIVTALDSYERRRDWGLIYPAKIEVLVAVPVPGEEHH
jgi:poly(3-hydroxybutyrate) depolymerase